MAEVQTEAQAEDMLLAAVLAPDEQVIDGPDRAKLDPPDDIDAEEEAEQAEGEEKAPVEAKGAQEAAEEDEVEIAGADGAEPTRVKLADLVASHQAYQALRGQEAQITERVEREAIERMAPQLRNVEQYSQRAATMIQAAMQLMQAPQPPNEVLLDPSSPHYNPDNYHRAFAQYQRMAGQHNQAIQLGGQLFEQAQAAAAHATEVRETAELGKLLKVWPEFNQAEHQDKFVSDMGKAYGFSRDELDAVLTDHRQAIVARDALAYRAMKAQSGDVKAKVEAKAPKLVRSKQEAKGGASPRDRAQNGRFTSDALGALKKTQSDDAAVAFFAGLARDGRI